MTVRSFSITTTTEKVYIFNAHRVLYATLDRDTDDMLKMEVHLDDRGDPVRITGINNRNFKTLAGIVKDALDGTP